MDAETARRRIEDLNHDYAHCIDDDRLEEWPAFFTADCRYLIIDRENHALGRPVGIWTCTSRAMLEDRVLSLRQANVYEPHCYRHLISAIRVRGETGGVWEAQTSYAVIRTMQEGDVAVFSTGRYLDKVVFEDGRARFKARIVVCDTGRIDTLIVIPL
jgi:anthranilate 1,2-dioxygenase small subunit